MLNAARVVVERRIAAKNQSLLMSLRVGSVHDSRFVLQKKALGPEMINKQMDFFSNSVDVEDLPIRILVDKWS